MPHPWKNPKPGSYHLRIRLPSDIRVHAKGRRVVLPVADTIITITYGTASGDRAAHRVQVRASTHLVPQSGLAF